MLKVLLLVAVVKGTIGSGFGFDFFSRTNTGNVTLPATVTEAASLGWVLTKREDGVGVCREGLGVEYTEGSESHSVARPLSLFFDTTGHISAFSVRAWFSDASYYNPSTWQAPLFGAVVETERWVTITTRDPSSICSDVTPSDDIPMLGDRLIFNVDSSFTLTIPTVVPPSSEVWIAGACQADMSRHWGYPLDHNPNSLYGYNHGVDVLPVIPMYSETQEKVTALAFFTTEPQVTAKQGGIWDATGTPAQLCAGNFCLDADQCEYGEGNSVLHIFFVDQYTEPAQCGSSGSPGCPYY